MEVAVLGHQRTIVPSHGMYGMLPQNWNTPMECTTSDGHSSVSSRDSPMDDEEKTRTLRVEDIEMLTSPAPSQKRDSSEAPLRKLTLRLLQTYQLVNQKYYITYQKQKHKIPQRTKGEDNNGWDDADANYKVTIGEIIDERYEVQEILGSGSFGRVVKAVDRQLGELVAIKIIKNKIPFFKQALTEIELLEHMNKKDPEDKFFLGKPVVLPHSPNVVRMKRHFSYRFTMGPKWSTKAFQKSFVPRIRASFLQPFRSASDYQVSRCFAEPHSQICLPAASCFIFPLFAGCGRDSLRLEAWYQRPLAPHHSCREHLASKP